MKGACKHQPCIVDDQGAVSARRGGRLDVCSIGDVERDRDDSVVVDRD
jgi:hypothetical protein